jgi:polysaccharide export outer membrane protein
VNFRALHIFIIVVITTTSGCKLYRQNFMFQVENDTELATFAKAEIAALEKTYIIQPYDQLDLRVYTNKGERVIDPNFELLEEGNRNQQMREEVNYFVLSDSTVKVPMVGKIKLAGLTIDEAENLLEEAYTEYYEEPFVVLRYANKRVFVLGAPGGQVVPLQNENMSIIEALALAGGIDEGGKSRNIRLIRGDLNNPEVYLIDLSTIEGMKQSMLEAEPGDIIYVEPFRKVVTEGVRDVTIFLSLILNTVTIIVLLNNL